MSDDALVCFPTRIDWETARGPIQAAHYPAPLVTSRDPQEDAHPHPRPVDDLAVHARALGWVVRVTYAEGFFPHGTTGAPLGPKPSWAIRMDRAGQRAVAVRVDGSWRSLWLISDRWESYVGRFEEFKGALR